MATKYNRQAMNISCNIFKQTKQDKTISQQQPKWFSYLGPWSFSVGHGSIFSRSSTTPENRNQSSILNPNCP